MQKILDIHDLEFGYGKTSLFDGLNLKIETGGLYGLLGKNGAGKSSLLKIIGGQLFPKAGSVNCLDEEPARRSPELLSRIYYLPEDIYLPPIKGDSYVSLNAPFYPDFDTDLMDKTLRLFEVPEGKKLNTLSYGQKKKYLIAFAVATNCPVLLLDEPTNGLDIPSKSQFRQVTAGMDLENRTVIISTHQVRDMEMLIDPVIIVEQGKIILNSSLGDINDHCHMEFRETEPEPGDALYWEKILGGWSAVVKGPSPEGSSMDLEFLFNFVVAQGGLK